MRRFGVGLGLTLLVGCLAMPAWASFQASDLVYLPVAAHSQGAEDSTWRTDVYITNVDETPVDVCLYFFPSGGFSNSGFLDREFALGGRSEEGFGYVNEGLAGIPPNGTIVIEDVLGAYWFQDFGLNAELGAMAVFAYEAGTLDAAGGRTYRNVVVQSRTYNLTVQWTPDPENEGEFIEEEVTYGQTVVGVPWYNLADPDAITEFGDFSLQVLAGGTDTEDYRYNVGMFNASDPQTSVNLIIEPLQADGTPFIDELEQPVVLFVTLPPLAHVQYYRLLNVLLGNEEDLAAVTVRVSFFSWSTTSPDPIPAFTCYGSVLDNRSSDPTTIQPSFAAPYNVDCMWQTDEGDGGGGKSIGARRRPLDIPPK